MDMQMPVLDGIGASEALRAMEATRGLPRTPVIALTANVMSEDRQRCEAAPAASTAPSGRRPVLPDEALDTVQLEHDLEDAFPAILRDTLQDMRDSLASMADERADGALAVLAHEAHRMKGIVGAIGARRVAALAQAMDRAARSGDLAGASALLPELAEETRTVESALAARIGG
jgi:CheY-like chemotaxis protein